MYVLQHAAAYNRAEMYPRGHKGNSNRVIAWSEHAKKYTEQPGLS